MHCLGMHAYIGAAQCTAAEYGEARSHNAHAKKEDEGDSKAERFRKNMHDGD